jgi:hypothetical protein
MMFPFWVVVSVWVNGLIMGAARTAAPGSYCVWVVVQLMHFCFQIGRDSDRSHLSVKSKIQILSKARRKGLTPSALCFDLTTRRKTRRAHCIQVPHGNHQGKYLIFRENLP